MMQHSFDDRPFEASIYGTNVGTMSLTRFALSNLVASTTAKTIRHPNNKTDQLLIGVTLSGTVRSEQNGHSDTTVRGDLVVRDTNRPWTIEHLGNTNVLAIGLPRQRLEAMLGSARHYAGLTLGGHLPTTRLVRSFLRDLLRVGDQLTPDAADRMTSIAIDLITASIAERMAVETPKSLHHTVTVQRAKAFIEAHLSDPSLDPPSLAAAMGVSLRSLHQLFHAQGRNVSDWIWRRRLEVAAQRLADPGLIHLSIGSLSYNCGFTSQAHFSRRFKHQYGFSPRDYRCMASGQTASGIRAGFEDEPVHPADRVSPRKP